MPPKLDSAITAETRVAMPLRTVLVVIVSTGSLTLGAVSLGRSVENAFQGIDKRITSLDGKLHKIETAIQAAWTYPMERDVQSETKALNPGFITPDVKAIRDEHRAAAAALMPIAPNPPLVGNLDPSEEASRP